MESESHFSRKTANGNYQFEDKKHEYLFHTKTDKPFKGTVAIQELPHLHKGSI